MDMPVNSSFVWREVWVPWGERGTSTPSVCRVVRDLVGVSAPSLWDGPARQATCRVPWRLRWTVCGCITVCT